MYFKRATYQLYQTKGSSTMQFRRYQVMAKAYIRWKCARTHAYRYSRTTSVMTVRF